MYSCQQDHHHTAAARTGYDTTSGYQLQPYAAAGRSLHLPPAHHHLQRGRVDPPAGGSSAAAGVQPQPQQPRRANNKKKHGAARPPPSRRSSSTTVVATDVANFRAMVQELTGFPPAAIFRPLPRRVQHVVSSSSNPFAAGVAAGHQGCGADGRGQTGSETATNNTAAGGSLISLDLDAPAVHQPVLPPQFATPGVFDGLPDIGSPVFDTWADLSID